MAAKRRAPRKSQPSPPPPPPPPPPSAEESDDGGDDSETEEGRPVLDPPAPRAAVTGKPSGKDDATTAKKSIQRIWSNEDQMALVKGMVDYIATQGKDPVANIEGFWLFIRKELSFPVTELQLMRKIRMVKEKYMNNQKKDRVFSKAYDAEVFELSRKVWGTGQKSVAPENSRGNKGKSNIYDKEEAEAEAVEKCGNGEGVDDDGLEWDDKSVNLMMGNTGWSPELAGAVVKSMAETQRKSFAQRWKKLKAEELSCLASRRSLESGTMSAIF
ncbi:hypothetical protein MLD38_017437 [Melastoma candidum]|uniref:Uncharacterized protein n=1 Tax=Melastoma candidum TaxID=119954 RepID=A0ACB9QQ29_9MYRT|nr:hypothetical protein MLD38_017437 [Melastoma candidum]